jgi:hypothetical protein
VSADSERSEHGEQREVEGAAAPRGTHENPYLEQDDQQRQRIHPKLARVLDRHQVDGKEQRGKRRDCLGLLGWETS